MRVMLQPGQVASNVDLRLSKPETVAVTVVDSAGKPVSGAKLSQLMWKSQDANPVWLPEPFLRRLQFDLPVSDEGGHLEVPWIPAGAESTIRVSHEDFAIGESPALIATNEPTILKLHHGQPVTIRVIDSSTKRPVTDAIVSVLDGPLSPFAQSEQKVDAKGEFRMRIANGKRVYVQVKHPTLADARAYFFWKDEPKTIEVPLYRRAEILGRVVDTAGSPVENVRVSFSIPSNSSLFSSGAVTDRDGRYELEAREGEGAATVKNGRGYVYEGKQVPIRLEAGGVTTLNDFVVSPIRPIRGIVVDTDGTPLPYALISDRSLPTGGQQTQADAQGRFELPLMNLPRLATHVIVRHPTKQLSGGMVIAYDDVRQGNHFRIAVQPESTLSGRIAVAGSDRELASGIRVSAEMLIDMGKRKYMLPVASVVTDNSGAFRFQGLSRHTQYYVNATNKGTRSIPEELIELQEDIVELPEPLQIDASEASIDEASEEQLPPPLACSAWINSIPLKLNQLEDKVVLIDFWATWCGPCVKEMPKLELAHRFYADKGLVLIGVHDNSMSEEDVRLFVEQRKISFPIALDNSRGDTSGRYNVTTWPTKILIDRRGKLLTMSRHDDLIATLRALLLYGND